MLYFPAMIFRMLYVVVFLSLAACSTVPTDEYLDQLAELQQSSDSTAAELKTISLAEAESLYQQSSEWKERFRPFANDTLELDFARKLDAYLQAHQQLLYLLTEKDICQHQNELVSLRMKLLRKDIELGAGERGSYAKSLQRETREVKKIREHSRSLKTRFEAAKTAISDNQAVIEQFVIARESKL